MEKKVVVNGLAQSPERRASDWGPIALLAKTKEFFRICDMEGKGFITRTDMRVREGSCVCCCECVKPGLASELHLRINLLGY